MVITLLLLPSPHPKLIRGSSGSSVSLDKQESESTCLIYIYIYIFFFYLSTQLQLRLTYYRVTQQLAHPNIFPTISRSHSCPHDWQTKMFV